MYLSYLEENRDEIVKSLLKDKHIEIQEAENLVNEKIRRLKNLKLEFLSKKISKLEETVLKFYYGVGVEKRYSIFEIEDELSKLQSQRDEMHSRWEDEKAALNSSKEVEKARRSSNLSINQSLIPFLIVSLPVSSGYAIKMPEEGRNCMHWLASSSSKTTICGVL